MSDNIASFSQISPKQALKCTIFFNIQKKAKNGQMDKPFNFLANSFKEGQIWQILPIKRLNGNPAS